MNCIKLSATSIQDFLACPVKYRLKHIEQIVPEVEADSLRIGTTWHKLREVAAKKGTDAVVEELNRRYEKCPPYKTPDEWLSEREMLLSLWVCYQSYWSANPLPTQGQEIVFEMPIYTPAGLPVHPKKAIIKGRIDEVVEFNGRLCVHEYKTTSDSIEPDSDYWHKLRRDPQVSIYALAAARRVSSICGRIGGVGEFQFSGNVLYDVVRKPRHRLNKGETVEHFGERLREVIAAEPQTYFVRQEIARTDAELAEFEKELYAIYQAIRDMTERGNWYSNPGACKSPYPCVYLPVNNSQGCRQACAAEVLPAGFVRLTSCGKVV